jgi:hypothetical protein
MMRSGRILEMVMEKVCSGRSWRGMAGLALVAVLVAACGGGADQTKALLRAVNASGGYDALTLSLDGSSVQAAVPYAGQAAYAEVDPKGASATVSVPGSATVLTTTSVALSKKNHYTLLSYGKAGALSAMLLNDDNAAPDSGKSLLRIVHAAPDAGPLDVYLTAGGDALATATPLQTAAAVGALGAYNTIVSGAWRLRIAAQGSKTDLRLDVAALDFASQGVFTLVLTPGRGGMLVNALLLAQQGGITNAANTQARVRVVAGVTDSGAVSASLGGTALLSGVAAPAQSNYTLLTAGSVPVVVSANGHAAALTSATLAAGGDYTLLAYGTPAAPAAVVLTDDNTLPGNASGSKLRLVHGLADVGSPLSLQVDLVVVADGVAQGTASPYVSVDPSVTARLTATAAGFAGSTAADQTFLAGANYTFFVVGSASAPVPILHRDR